VGEGAGWGGREKLGLAGGVLSRPPPPVFTFEQHSRDTAPWYDFSCYRMRSAWFILAVIVLLAAAAVLLPSSIYVRQDLCWIDAISGSQKRQTVWRGGASSSPVVSDSLLAERYRKLGLRWEPHWRNVEGTYRNAFGRSVGHAHGSAPEIYDLSMSRVLQGSYLAASSDEDVREFFRVMSSGTEAEKKTAVEAACDKALGERPATRPTE
jgi:hypothetical protein